jgi:hypothetical protein
MNRTLALTFATALASFGCAENTAPPDDTTLRMRVDRDVGEGKNIFGNDNFETQPTKPGEFVAYTGWLGSDDVVALSAGPFVSEAMVINGQECAGLDAPLGVPPDEFVVDGAAAGVVLVVPADVELPEAGAVSDLGDIEFDIRWPSYRVSVPAADREAGAVEGLDTYGADWAIVDELTAEANDQRFIRR